MSENNSLGLIELKEIREKSALMITSNLRPSHLKSVADAVTAYMYGKDRGMSLTQSWEQVYVYNGRAGLKAEGMLALIKYHVPQSRIQILQRNIEGAKIKVWEDYKEDKDFFNIFEYTIEDARRAKLADNPKKENWQKYPRQMLWARVISEMSRTIFPHVIGGLYVVEELQDFDEKEPITRKAFEEAQNIIEGKEDIHDGKTVIDAIIEEVKPKPRPKPSKEEDAWVKSLIKANMKIKKFPSNVDTNIFREYYKDAEEWECLYDTMNIKITNETLAEYQLRAIHEEIYHIPKEEVKPKSEGSLNSSEADTDNSGIDNTLKNRENEVGSRGGGVTPPSRTFDKKHIMERKNIAKQLGSTMNISEFNKLFFSGKDSLEFDVVAEEYREYKKDWESKPAGENSGDLLSFDAFVKM